MSRSSKPIGCVYAIRCKVNGRIYIGSTVDVNERLYVHYQELKKGEKSRKGNVEKLYVYATWQADFNNYGIDSFENYILERDIPREKLHSREQFWINEYHTDDPEFGYNRHSVIKAKHNIVDGMPPNKSKGAK